MTTILSWEDQIKMSANDMYDYVKECFKDKDCDENGDENGDVIACEMKYPEESIYEQLNPLLINNGYNIRYIRKECENEKCKCGKKECENNQLLRITKYDPIRDSSPFSMAWMYR
jgi:hypothetical protein